MYEFELTVSIIWKWINIALQLPKEFTNFQLVDFPSISGWGIESLQLLMSHLSNPPQNTDGE